MEWHPTKNSQLSPDDVRPKSHKKVWWLCNKGHEWQSTVANRSLGRGCPYCAGKAACNDNSLAVKYPDLIQEWHSSRNGELTPDKVMPRSDKNVWWVCRRGHEYQAIIKNRTRGQGCPQCHSPSSRLEMRILAELKHLFKKAYHREKIGGAEADIILPNQHVAIEIDGLYWHSHRHKKELKKNEIFHKSGFLLLRLREQGLPRLTKNDIFFETKDNHFDILTKLIRKIIKVSTIDRDLRDSLEKYLMGGITIGDEEFQELLTRLPGPALDDSLGHLFPEIGAEWHSTKNSPLTPSDVSPYSNQSAWWRCDAGHEWQAIINNRTKGRGCPFCSNKAVCADNSFATLRSDLIAEWHPQRNLPLMPENIVPGSGKRVWWQCKQGHEWKARIIDRTKGKGCPYCAGIRIAEERSLAVLRHEIAAEWHPSRNDPLTTFSVGPSSHKTVWWRCKCGHEWQDSVAHRTYGRRCPQCFGKRSGRTYIQRPAKDNSLAEIRPDLASQWHPILNGELTPNQIKPNSHKKVWWLCKEKHAWDATVQNRNNGSGCPYCAGK